VYLGVQRDFGAAALPARTTWTMIPGVRPWPWEIEVNP